MEYVPPTLKRIKERLEWEYMAKFTGTTDVFVTLDVENISISGYGHYELNLDLDDYLELKKKDEEEFKTYIKENGKFILDDISYDGIDGELTTIEVCDE